MLLNRYSIGFKEKILGRGILPSSGKVLKRQLFAIHKGGFLSSFKVMAGLTNRCQCYCSHCGMQVYSKNEDREMSTEQWKDVIEQISGLPYPLLCVSFFGGESLLRQDVFELIAYADRKGLFCELETNGILLTVENIRKLRNNGVSHVFVSVDSPSAQEHDRRRNYEGCFEKALEAIRNCKREKVSCSISTVIGSRLITVEEIQKLIDLAQYHKVTSVRLLPCVDKGKFTLNRDYLNSVKKLLNPHFVYLESTRCNDFNCISGCSSLKREFLYISCSGEVQPCPYIPISFGSLKHENLRSVVNTMWDSALFREYSDVECIERLFYNRGEG